MWVFVVVVCCNLLDFVVAICGFFNTGDVGFCGGGCCDLWVTGWLFWWVAGWAARWVAGWVWVAGWQWGSFLVDSGGFGCGYFLFICFTLLQTHNVKYFLKHFPRVQTNIEKINVFL